MYKQFYGLKRAPFELTPDPTFFFATPQHNEAMANLWCGVQQRKGFVVVTGDVGSGKTLLVRYLLLALSHYNVQFCHVFNPRLTSTDFLHYVLADFDMPSFGKSKAELLVQLNRWLIAKHSSGSTAALVVDEAHLLDWDVLEEIRLLTNLETTEHKLLQVVLIGQPELDEKLDSPQLRQLKQRIAFRARLSPLTETETSAYIQQRLQTAGAKPEPPIFSQACYSLIYRYSGGVPRLINSICENALITGFAKQTRVIGHDVIQDIARDFGLKSEQSVSVAEIKAAGSSRDDRRSVTGQFGRLPAQKVI